MLIKKASGFRTCTVSFQCVCVSVRPRDVHSACDGVFLVWVYTMDVYGVYVMHLDVYVAWTRPTFSAWRLHLCVCIVCKREQAFTV